MSVLKRIQKQATAKRKMAKKQNYVRASDGIGRSYLFTQKEWNTKIKKSTRDYGKITSLGNITDTFLGTSQVEKTARARYRKQTQHALSKR